MIKRSNMRLSAATLVIVLTTALLAQTQQQPKHDSSMSQTQMDEMMKRGNKVMGFDQMKTTHHFLLRENGGLIQIQANDGKDNESRDEIRRHLRHIASMFGEGNFNAPMLIHDQTPPGTETMKRLKAEIGYEFKELERGAVIRISTRNAEALAAIHEFLVFQINEHKTGDPLEVPRG